MRKDERACLTLSVSSGVVAILVGGHDREPLLIFALVGQNANAGPRAVVGTGKGRGRSG